ncbi:hypothetical protein HXX76_003429 [Chlamydomonas incerta]|nr:hypothetical protein HXX76_003429 [Chlamydomonas incerta]|eukprot:KAG2441821.1 hypothetical protein HXX76_003429 [Chlamydomonas incerta]
MDSGYLPLLAARLAAAGFACVRFTCKPPHLPTRVAAFEAVLRAAAAEWPETRGVRHWFVAGHSMGGRAACQVAHTSWIQHQHQHQEQHTQQAHGSKPQQGQVPARGGPHAPGAAATDGGGDGPASKRRRGAAVPDRADAAARASSMTAAAADPQEAGAQEGQGQHEQHQQHEHKHEPAAAEADAAVGTPGAADAVAAKPERRRGPARAARPGSGPAAARATKDFEEAGDGGEGGSGGPAGRQPVGRAPTQARGARRSKQAAAAGGEEGGEAGVLEATTAPLLPRVSGCVLLSYPLHPPDKPNELRDAPLVGLRLPVLFVRGSRDAFSLPVQQWEQTLGCMREAGCPSLQVHTVEGGDHGLAVPASARRAGATEGGRAGKSAAGGAGAAGRGAGASKAGLRGSDAGAVGPEGEGEGAGTPLDAALQAAVDWVAAQCSGPPGAAAGASA